MDNLHYNLLIYKVNVNQTNQTNNNLPLTFARNWDTIWPAWPLHKRNIVQHVKMKHILDILKSFSLFRNELKFVQ